MRFRPRLASKLGKVRPHHHAEVWRRRRRRGAQLGGPRPWQPQSRPAMSACESRPFDRLARRGSRHEKARGRRPRPRQQDSAAQPLFKTTSKVAKPAARISARAGSRGRAAPVGDVHWPHAARSTTSKRPVIEWKLQRAGGLERDLPALAGSFGQIARGIHERSLRSTPITRQP